MIPDQDPVDSRQACEDYEPIAAAIRYVIERRIEQPSLAELAAHLGMSESGLQRRFTRWVGVSPKRFWQFLTKEEVKRRLLDSRSVLEASFAAGLSSPGRLHDLLVACDAMTPGECRAKGEGMVIRHGVVCTPFGQALIAVSRRGVCRMDFEQGMGLDFSLDALRADWPRAEIIEDPAAAREVADRIFRPGKPDDRLALPVALKGTNFQIKVWEALLRLPEGAVTSYSALARAIGHERASRAVGTAVGANPVSWIIPCHRVIRESGEFGSYGGGEERKQAMLAWEGVSAGLASGGR